MKALVIGGTGPTGPAVVRGLLERGYEVTIYHRGVHEVADMPQVHHHLHGNADDPEALRAEFGAGEWDVVCAMYGRSGRSEDLFAGRCGRFIYISGQGGYARPGRLPFPQGRGLPIREDHPRTVGNGEGGAYASTVVECERRVLAHHAMGDYNATVFVYTSMYGPRAPRHPLWPIVKRLLDGRRQILVPGDGSQLRAMCYADNASQQILRAIDRPEASGQLFNAVDQHSYYLRDIVRLVADALNVEVEVVGVNHPYADKLATAYTSHENWLWDAAKLTYVLGFTDAVPAAEAIQRTARWQADHQDEIDHVQLQRVVPDPFAYDLEDRLIAAHRAWQQQVIDTLPPPPDVSVPSTGRNFRYDIPATQATG